MKKNIQVGLLLLLLLAPTTVFGAARTRRAAAACTGSTPCRACKNCRHCVRRQERYGNHRAGLIARAPSRMANRWENRYVGIHQL
jgi:hypothetical protein